MKQTVVQICCVMFVIAASTQALSARQAIPLQPQRPRGGAQQAPRDVPKQTQQLPRNLTADKPASQPNASKRNEQVQKDRVANAVVDRYLGGFQNQVGLDDDQTRKLSGRLGNYIRQQLRLADRRNEASRRLRELNDQKASEEDIQAQYRILDETESQQILAKRRFYSDINSRLSVPQQARLRTYMDQTEQDVRQAIQKSRNE